MFPAHASGATGLENGPRARQATQARLREPQTLSRSQRNLLMRNTSAIDPSTLVLVVEDEVFVRMVAVEALLDAGYAVLEAEHAAMALEQLASRADEVAAICTDVHMPGSIDGMGLAKHVAATWPAIGLLIMSGKARPAAGELPMRARFLAKPYGTDDLLLQVGELCRA